MLRKYVEGADFVMRYERLQEDFDDVLARLGTSERHENPHVNVTRARERLLELLHAESASHRRSGLRSRPGAVRVHVLTPPPGNLGATDDGGCIDLRIRRGQGRWRTVLGRGPDRGAGLAAANRKS